MFHRSALGSVVCFSNVPDRNVTPTVTALTDADKENGVALMAAGADVTPLKPATVMHGRTRRDPVGFTENVRVVGLNRSHRTRAVTGRIVTANLWVGQMVRDVLTCDATAVRHVVFAERVLA